MTTPTVMLCLRPIVHQEGGDAFAWTIYHRRWGDGIAHVGILRRGHQCEPGAWVAIDNSWQVHAGDTPEQALAAFEADRPRIRVHAPGGIVEL